MLQRKEFILPLYIKTDVEGLFENEQNRLIYSYIRAAIYCWLISIMYLGVLACMPLDIGHMPTHMFLFTTLQGISSCENKHFDSGIVVKHCGQGDGALREIYQHERCLWYISSFIPYCMYKVSMWVESYRRQFLHVTILDFIQGVDINWRGHETWYHFENNSIRWCIWEGPLA